MKEVYISSNAFNRGYEDYSKGVCLVYRAGNGRLIWDSDNSILEDEKLWAEDYIAGFGAASEDEDDKMFQTVRQLTT